jgi:hypothetical protein
MKKILLLACSVVLLMGFYNINTYAEQNNVLLEFCTGAWCGYCPCGELSAENVLTNFPNTMVLAYHGGGVDPYANFNGNNILSLLGFSAYPSGVIGRRNGIIAWTTWNNPVVIQTNTLIPGVSIAITKSYNSSTRQLQVTANVTSQRQIDTACNINFVITEDHLWCTQSNYNYCPEVTCTYCEHNWVVRNMVNGAAGSVLSSGSWASNTLKSASWTTTLDNAWVADNCSANVFVYFVTGGPLNSGDYVQQTLKQAVTLPLGVTHNNEIPANYSLSQNYPNPFNPTTNIHFSLPKDGNVNLKIYDMIGNEIAVIANGFVKAGSYNVDVDASNWASGVYFYKLTAGSFVETKKMMLIK